MTPTEASNRIQHAARIVARVDRLQEQNEAGWKLAQENEEVLYRKVAECDALITENARLREALRITMALAEIEINPPVFPISAASHALTIRQIGGRARAALAQGGG